MTTDESAVLVTEISSGRHSSWLTNDDLDALSVYIRRSANRLGLTEWAFLISDTPIKGESDAWAQSDFVYGRRFGTFTFCEEFRELTPKRQRHVVLHELLHCHFEMAMQAMKTSLFELLDSDQGNVQKLFIQAVVHHVELQTDLLAQALGDFFPLIDWPKEDEAENSTETTDDGIQSVGLRSEAAEGGA